MGFEGAEKVLLGEVDARKLYREHACSSLFRFCTERLGMSEGAAYKRIAVARCARRLPAVLEALEGGQVHRAGLAVLAPHLTVENAASVLGRAHGKSRRNIEEISRALAPKPDVAVSIRRVSVPQSARDECRQPMLELSPGTVGKTRAVPVKPAHVVASAPARYHVRFTASAELKANLDRAKELVGIGADVESLFERAMELLVADLEKKKLGAAERAAKVTVMPKRSTKASTGRRSRYIAKAVRRAVHERDAGLCTFVDSSGLRCSERSGLELDHVVPFALGGKSTTENLRLRCRAHNQLHAEACFGPLFMQRQVVASG